MQTSEVSEELCEIIYEETGITVKPEDLKYETKDRLTVFLFDEKLTEIDSDYIEEDDLAYLIYETVEHPRDKITENRVKYLTKIIDAKIKAQGLYDLEYNIENMGYISRSRHYTVDAEIEWDYPDLVLIVERKGKMLEWEINPYSDTITLDLGQL